MDCSPFELGGSSLATPPPCCVCWGSDRAARAHAGVLLILACRYAHVAASVCVCAQVSPCPHGHLSTVLALAQDPRLRKRCRRSSPVRRFRKRGNTEGPSAPRSPDGPRHASHNDASAACREVQAQLVASLAGAARLAPVEVVDLGSERRLALRGGSSARHQEEADRGVAWERSERGSPGSSPRSGRSKLEFGRKSVQPARAAFGRS